MPADQRPSQSASDLDEDELPVPPTPPDGGYGWVILFASLMTSFIVDGVTFSFFVFLTDLRDYFSGESTSVLAFIGSLIPGLYLSLGPVAGALANKFGCRPVSIVGWLIAAAGFVISIFSKNVTHLIITYGVLGGVGFGLVYLPSIVIVNFYFEKMRALATGIAVCGSGVGTFAFAPLARFLLNKYSWRGGNLILAGIVLNGLIMAALLRPLVAERPKKKKRPEATGEGIKPVPSIIMQKIREDKERQRTISTGSLDGAVITTDDVLITNPEEIKKIKEELLISAHADLTKSKTGSAGNIPTVVVSDAENGHPNGNLGNLGKVSFHQGDPEATSLNGSDVSDRSSAVRFSAANPRVAELKQSELAVPFRPRTASNVSKKSTTSARSQRSSESLRKEVSRPLYRQDIFYSGSVHSLAEYKSSSDVQSYIKSTTSLPPEDGGKCAPFTAAISKLFDFSVFRSFTFLIVLTHNFLSMLGFYTPFVYVPQYVMDSGVDKTKAAFLVSILGISNVVGRILSGFLSDRPWADAVLINNLALIIGGSATIVLPWLPNYGSWAAFSVVYGLCIAAHISLRSIMCVELLGLERLTSSFGIMLLFQGIGSLAATPVLGALKDATGGYTTVFIASGVLMAVAGLLCCTARRVARWEQQNEARSEAYAQVPMKPVPPVPDDV